VVDEDKYSNQGLEEEFSSARQYVEFLVSDLMMFVTDTDELSQGDIEEWAKGLGEDVKNPLVEIAINAVKERLDKPRSIQTSELFVDIAEEIERLAGRLSNISGIKRSEVLMLVAKVLEEEERNNGTYK
jgi:phage portal protein BeeE